MDCLLLVRFTAVTLISEIQIDLYVFRLPGLWCLKHQSATSNLFYAVICNKFRLRFRVSLVKEQLVGSNALGSRHDS